MYVHMYTWQSMYDNFFHVQKLIKKKQIKKIYYFLNNKKENTGYTT